LDRPGEAAAQAAGPTATDVFNFALNLEYLEAEFYVRATFNRPLAELVDVDGVGNLGGVTGGRGIDFSSDPAVGRLARELALDELAHVRFLRNILGAARIARPSIDFIQSFNAVGRVTGLTTPTGTFDAFANPTNFLLGSFLFEDVGVTAYKGATPLIRNNEFLEQAAGILAVEAYHAGTLRAFLAGRNLFNPTRAISDLRDFLDGANNEQDQGIDFGPQGESNYAPTDANALAFSRTPAQVLAIVYANGNAQPGGFFPNGVNGTIR
jgi:hypothetical protein